MVKTSDTTPSSRPTYERLRGTIDEPGYQRALGELDRRYAWIPGGEPRPRGPASTKGALG